MNEKVLNMDTFVDGAFKFQKAQWKNFGDRSVYVLGVGVGGTGEKEGSC